MSRSLTWTIRLLVFVLGLAPVIGRADPLLVDRLEARNIGPANMGGRIVDLAVVESNPDTFYFAVATGGLWKTTDGGKSLNPIFDDQSTLSLGAVAIAPSDPNTLWVGADVCKLRIKTTRPVGQPGGSWVGASWMRRRAGLNL